MSQNIRSLFLAGAWLLACTVAHAEGRVDVSDLDEPAKTAEPSKKKSAESAVQKYFPKKVSREPASEGSSSEHYLAVHIGAFASDNAYSWGVRKEENNVGKWTVGVTYRVGEWKNSMDLNLRVDYSSYNLTEGQANKLSFLPMLIFPDASSKFPLYFGAGIGPGIYTKQVGNASVLALDYQLIAGARFFDLINNTGFFVEGGLKNAVHLLGSGQFNGTFIAVGSVFTF